MGYSTIFKTKPKKENKINFCKRITNLLDDIYIMDSQSTVLNGWEMLNYLFKHATVNAGYASVDDLLMEADENYNNIYQMCKNDEYWITDDELLANIEIIINCFYGLDIEDVYYFKKDDILKNIELLFGAIKEFLLCYGYKLEESSDRLCIVENEIAIDVENIENAKIKDEVISFYDYKNANDIEEKKKVMSILIGNLESRKNDIAKLLGSKIADMLSNYVNNLNLRHNNIDESYKKYYNKAVADLSKEEMIKWYDYVFAFMINIYLSLDKVKDINVNGGFK